METEGKIKIPYKLLGEKDLYLRQGLASATLGKGEEQRNFEVSVLVNGSAILVGEGLKKRILIKTEDLIDCFNKQICEVKND